MSSGGAFGLGGSRGFQPIPPEKGVFPLDHFGECKEEMKKYMKCLRDKKFVTDECNQFSKAYLACRMQRNLMAKQDLASLGFTEEASGKSDSSGNANPSQESSEKLSSIEQARRRAQSGFVAGIRRKQQESSTKTGGS
ncbi:hypothetical protein CBR_g27938 [Chara braunii]|uniref:CHCH domain-containing protein n=1 Tax=Chara braunii TaxID=69332 RepID=A0A388L945_CHABU|nr:hypothetical protein CBR_g27938 [Chara braunii]|eukprot:GBG78713.1 hypothetical protein CBR_g27938 [Chara braunii]